MKHLIQFSFAASLAVAMLTSAANAHVLPWTEGASRQLGYGHCAKGPCMKRTCWAPTRPHRHIDGRVIIDRYGGAECWSSGSGRTRRL